MVIITNNSEYVSRTTQLIMFLVNIISIISIIVILTLQTFDEKKSSFSLILKIKFLFVVN